MIIWGDDYTMTYEIRDFINSRILELFKEEGIEIPLPRVDIYMKKE